MTPIENPFGLVWNGEAAEHDTTVGQMLIDDAGLREWEGLGTMEILIIGGTGLISTPITRFLLERGDNVTHYNRGTSDLYPVPEGVHSIHGDRTDHATFE